MKRGQRFAKHIREAYALQLTFLTWKERMQCMFSSSNRSSATALPNNIFLLRSCRAYTVLRDQQRGGYGVVIKLLIKRLRVLLIIRCTLLKGNPIHNDIITHLLINS